MLSCIKTFNEGGLQVVKGETYEGVQEDYLLSNFPAYFVKAEAAPAQEPVAVEVEAKDVAAPPVDKMVKRAGVRK